MAEQTTINVNPDSGQRNTDAEVFQRQSKVYEEVVVDESLDLPCLESGCPSCIVAMSSNNCRVTNPTRVFRSTRIDQIDLMEIPTLWGRTLIAVAQRLRCLSSSWTLHAAYCM